MLSPTLATSGDCQYKPCDFSHRAEFAKQYSKSMPLRVDSFRQEKPVKQLGVVTYKPHTTSITPVERREVFRVKNFRSRNNQIEEYLRTNFGSSTS